jgi:hypothetical protein
MLGASRTVFPSSAHLELPWWTESGRNGNPWLDAFVWIRKNTAKGALVALDARYITEDGEDAQCFRAVAERSSLPDFSKDGGEAAITPSLADAWLDGQRAQGGLWRASDPERVERLRRRGVSWVVLPGGVRTEFRCPYSNRAVKVCALP